MPRAHPCAPRPSDFVPIQSAQDDLLSALTHEHPVQLGNFVATKLGFVL